MFHASRAALRFLRPASFLLPFLFAAASLAAQTYTLSGKVTDTEGFPLPGAAVVLDGGFAGAATNTEGKFKIERLKAGVYNLQVRFIGYQTHEQTVEMNGDRELKVKMHWADLLADEIIVYPTRAEEGEAAQTTISKEELERQNLGRDMPYLLNQTPSVVVTSDAGTGVGYTGIRIRGSDATRVNVTINGIPLNDSESQGTFWVDLPDFASSVEDIQIQRGLGTSSNGAGAFGGTVNLQTSTLAYKPYGEISGSYGSFNTFKTTLKAGSGMIDDRFTFDARLSYIGSDGYVDRASAKLRSLFVSGGYYSGKNILRIHAFSGKETTYQAWNGVPENLLETDRKFNEFTYDNQVDDYQQDHYQLHYSRQINKHWNLGGALHLTKGRGFFEQYKEGENLLDYGLDPVLAIGGDTLLVEETDLIRRKWLDNVFYGLTYAAQYFKNNTNFTLGGAWNDYKGDHFGEVVWAGYAGGGGIRHRFYDNTGDKMDFNVYAKVNQRFNDRLSAFVDLQYRRIGYQVEGVDEDAGEVGIDTGFNFFNPKAGLRLDFDDNSGMYLTYGMASREPNRDNFIDNEQTPRPEKMHDIELGYSRRSSLYSLNLNGYHMHYKDQLVLTGNLNDVGEPVLQNVDKSWRTGLELSLGIQPLRNLRWTANATFGLSKIKEFAQNTCIFNDAYDCLADTTIVYKATDISFSPRWMAASTLTYEPLSGLELELLGKYVGRQYMDNTQAKARSLDGYLACDFRAAYTIKTRFMREIGLTLMVNNIFNSLYESNGYTYFLLFEREGRVQADNYNFYYPQAGTNLMGGVVLKF